MSTPAPRRLPGRSGLASVLTAAAALTLAPPSRAAGPSAEELAVAEAMFKNAIAQMKDNQFEQACPKLEEVARLTEGLGAKLELARCFERWGKVTSAWATYKEVAAKAAAAGQTTRAAEARSAVQQLESRLTFLSLRLAPAVRAIEGLELRKDGRVVPPEAWDTKLPIDPGPHQITVSAPGRVPVSWRLEVAPGSKEIVEDVRAPEAIAAASASASPVVTAPPPVSPASAPSSADSASAPASSPPSPPPPRSARLGTRGTVGIVSGAAGVVSLGAAAFFAVSARSKWSSAHQNDHCDAAHVCDEQGLSLIHDAHGAANWATAFSLAGVGALAVGTFLFLSDRESEASQSARVVIKPSVGLHGGLATLAGSW